MMIRYDDRYTDPLYCSTILLHYTDCSRQHVRLFISTGGLTKLWLTITNTGDNVLSGVCLLLNLANQSNVDTPGHNNMSRSDLDLPLAHVPLCDNYLH